MVNRLLGNLTAILASFLALATLPAPAAAAQPESPVQASLKASKASVAPGDQFVVAVVFQHMPGWHIHTNDPRVPRNVDLTPIPTTIRVAHPAELAVWPIKWPQPTPFEAATRTGGRARYDVFAGRAVALIPVQVPAAARPGEALDISVVATFQACDDVTCLMEEEHELTLSLPIAAVGQSSASTSASDRDFAAFDPAVFGQPPERGGQGSAARDGLRGASKPVRFNAFGLEFEVDPRGAGLVLLLLVAALGGFILNLTPCVLPVVPLKIMGLSAAAGNPARCFFLGSVMSAGVVAFWMCIGGAIAFISGFTAINTLFQTPWFSLGVGAFILVMALGMLGAYAVTLPRFVYMINPRHESAPGSFVFGIMTAVLSTPCTAPFMGSAAAWAATQDRAVTLLTFGAIGFGMALPYLVLSAFPGLVSRIPRTGPASELVKQVMGILLIAVGVFFLGTGLDPLMRLPVDPPMRWHWWLIAAIAVGGMGWVAYRTFRITRLTAARAGWTIAAGVFAAVSVAVAVRFTDRGPIPWIGYTPERLAEHLGSRRVVVLDFTAEWCINCKALESTVLHQRGVVEALTGPDVIPMRVDLTGNNREGKAKLKELGWVGIPLLVIYGPGAPEPIKYDSYTPEMVREAIARAAGRPADSPSASAQAPPPPRS